MTNLATAERLLSIESELRGRLAPSLRAELTEEHRRLWDLEFKGASHEQITHDVWRARVVASVPVRLVASEEG